MRCLGVGEREEKERDTERYPIYFPLYEASLYTPKCLSGYLFYAFSPLFVGFFKLLPEEIHCF